MPSAMRQALSATLPSMSTLSLQDLPGSVGLYNFALELKVIPI